jgi:Putative peptidoglycan binding domain
MKKSLFIALFLGVAMLAGSVPVISNAQAYYGGSYSTYGATQGCIDLTVYQQFDSTDAGTGGQVSLLQEFLNETGYLSGVSGTYDAGTVGAVINYQNAYRLQATGTLTPETIAQIDAQSCNGSYNVGGYGAAPSYPITNYPGGSNCYWSGTYNSTYVCRTPATPVIGYPVAPVYPATNYGNGSYCNNVNSFNTSYYNTSGYNNGSNCGVQLLSLSASYNYNTTTITMNGYGFSPSGNTVYFGNSVISNVYSNGSTLVFSVPTGYAYGTYSIRVANSQGGSSNALSFAMSSNNYFTGSGYNNGSYNTGVYNNGSYNNNCTTGYGYVNTYNNNCNNVAPSLSAISGPTSVQAGVTNTWSVANLNTSTAYSSLSMNWGDGSSSIANTNGSYGYGNGSNSTFSHAFRTPGTYVIRVTATNSNALTSYETYTVTVTGNGYVYGNNNVYNNNNVYSNNSSYYSRTISNFGSMMQRYW